MCVTNCVNCGAPIDLNESKCPYCGTMHRMVVSDPDQTDIHTRYKTVLALLTNSRITPNEARRMLGLKEITVHDYTQYY